MSGAAPIPLAEMVAYMDLHDIGEHDERVKFAKMVRTLDATYLRWIQEQVAVQRANKPRKR